MPSQSGAFFNGLLGVYAKGGICRGIVSGLNEAFVLNRATRDSLIADTRAASEVIKPLVVGDDLRRYEIHFRESYLLYMRHGVDIGRYPSVERHLKPFRSRLEMRATQQEWYELQQPQEAYIRHFDGGKILYPEIGKVSRFVLDTSGYYPNNKGFFIPAADWFLLGVLNSVPVYDYLKAVRSVLGDEEDGGRLEFRAQYLETLPIPDAKPADREAVAALAREAQKLHGQRRTRVEKFLHAIGLPAAQSTSRNPLEQPWALPPEDFARRAPRADQKQFTAARDESIALTTQIKSVEHEIDARMAALYGL